MPPCDCPYYSHSSLCLIHIPFFIMGDMNTGFGKSVRDMAQLTNLQNVVSYQSIDDDVDRSNDNASSMSTLCINNKLVVVSNAKTRVNYLYS